MKYLPVYIFLLSLASCRGIVFSDGYHRYKSFSGYTSDTSLIKRSTEQEFAIYDIHTGDMIADIGFHYGSIEGALLLGYDSLHIYAEDYNIPARSKKVIEKTFENFAALRPKPNTNSIQIIKGGMKTTNLPKASFDKVILRKTLHHIEYKDEMIEEMASIMKPDGKLYIMEPSTDTTYYEPSCRANIMGRPEILTLLSRHHLKVISEQIMQNNKNDAAPWVAGQKEISFTVFVVKKM